MGLNWRGESWKSLGTAFHDAAVDLGPLNYRQYIVLSTCNRHEVFYYTSEQVQSSANLKALTYLFSIASGLESMVLGEYQILGQLKAAYAQAREEGHVGKELDRILRDAISCAKRVKTELDLGAVPPSVCRAGMDEIEKLLGCRDRRVFVIGSGRTGALAAELASKRCARSLAICNRSPERATALAERLGAKIVPYDRRYDAIVASDIVISATASPHTVITADKLAIAQPTLFLDLASPRDVDPEIAKDSRVTLITLDSIAELSIGDCDERRQLVEKGLQIIKVAVAKTEAWLNAL